MIPASQLAPILATLASHADKVAAVAAEAHALAEAGNPRAAIGAVLALDRHLSACSALAQAVAVLDRAD